MPDSSYDAHVASDGLSYGSVGVPSFGTEEEPQLQVTGSLGTQAITTDSPVVWVGRSVGVVPMGEREGLVQSGTAGHGDCRSFSRWDSVDLRAPIP